MAGVFSQPEFKRYLNQTFTAKDKDGSTCELTLSEVSEIREQEQCGSYYLIFNGSRDKFLNQGTYAISNDEYGEKEIFIVPVGESVDAFHYQAPFSFMK